MFLHSFEYFSYSPYFMMIFHFLQNIISFIKYWIILVVLKFSCMIFINIMKMTPPSFFFPSNFSSFTRDPQSSFFIHFNMLTPYIYIFLCLFKFNFLRQSWWIIELVLQTPSFSSRDSWLKTIKLNHRVSKI